MKESFLEEGAEKKKKKKKGGEGKRRGTKRNFLPFFFPSPSHVVFAPFQLHELSMLSEGYDCYAGHPEDAWTPVSL